MPLRKIRDAHEARHCLHAAESSGLHRAEWARQHGIDGRSLNAWRLNLARQEASEPPLRLVELLPSRAASSARYRLHVGDVSLEVDDDFHEDTLRRLLRVLTAC